ncbi:hypothetical protein MTO96_015232 [Rhipicephalus appendiculatus]
MPQTPKAAAQTRRFTFPQDCRCSTNLLTQMRQNMLCSFKNRAVAVSALHGEVVGASMIDTCCPGTVSLETGCVEPVQIKDNAFPRGLLSSHGSNELFAEASASAFPPRRKYGKQNGVSKALPDSLAHRLVG